MKKKYIEKLVVLANDAKTIVRLYIDHDGMQNYSIQRSNNRSGRATHFFNKKIWHSLYHANLILEREISQYEDKGYDVLDEFDLSSNETKQCGFRFDNHKISPDSEMLEISPAAVPLHIDLSFNEVSIKDMRYQLDYSNEAVTSLFEQITQMINFIPFSCYVVFDPSNNRLTLLSLDYNSKPKPSSVYSFEALYLQAKTPLALKSYTECIEKTNKTGTYVHFDGSVITFHFSGWFVANLLAECSNSGFNELYSMANGEHRLIHTAKLNIKHHQHAKFLLNVEQQQIKEVIYLHILDRTTALTEL